jgi:glucose-1-phosphate thymidylyltransferase
MKGVILAGGLATRLYPLTWATNKHLLPVYNKPMIFYPIDTLVRAGIKEVIIVVSGPHAGHFLSVLKNGKELGLSHLEYAYQDNPKGGIADALKITEDFADRESVAVILGDNTTDADISADVSSFENGAKIFLKKVPDPQRFGVPKIEAGKIIEIIEKPQEPPSDYAVTGLYLYDTKVYDAIRQLKPSDRNELEVTDLNNMYLARNELTWSELNGYWSDAGTFDTLFEANAYWMKKNKTLQNFTVKEFLQ